MKIRIEVQKRTSIDEYRIQGRGGMGIIDIQTGDRNGSAIGVIQVTNEDRVMLITNAGQVIKIPVANIRECHRNTKGVRCMKVDDKDWIVSMVKVPEDENAEDEMSEVDGALSEKSDATDEDSTSTE